MSLKIFKFGGASVKTAEGVKNLASIVKGQSSPLVVVVSAMGKTTNRFEQILSKYIKGDSSFWENFNSLKKDHLEIVSGLYETISKSYVDRVEALFLEVETLLRKPSKVGYNFSYDQIVSYGELISSAIISDYLNFVGIANEWIDIRKVLRTDSNFREGNINYKISAELCSKTFVLNDSSCKVYITQGFIGGTEEGHTTTLGREGSDYTAALLANLVGAESVTIWKDVEGVLNADPRIFPNAIKLDRVSFKEAIELAYCGAQIIHPKTIKPLQNKLISLFVKSFINPEGEGTLVYQTEQKIDYPPILILKSKQVLISLTPKDFSFVIEDCLSKIFAILYNHRVKANLIQSSAISFSICVDDEEHFLPGALEDLSIGFSVRYNRNLELLTVRHYNEQVIEKNTKGCEILLEQKTRSTLRVVMRQR